MAGSVTGLHVFAADVGPEPLSLLDGNFSPLATAINTLSTFSNYYVDSGAVNALAITVNAPQVVASYTDGLQVQVQVANTTTSATPTLAINGLGARTLIHSDGSTLAIGELVAGMRFTAIYDSTLAEFRILSPTFTAVTLNAPTFNATVTINAVAAKQSLVVNGAANQFTAVIQASTTASQSRGLEVNAGTNVSDFCFAFNNAANTITLAELLGNGQGFLGYNGTANTITWNAAGAVTIAAPSSGTGLTVAGGGIIINSPANPAGFLDIGATAPIIRLQAGGANGAICELFATNTVVGMSMNFATTAVPISIRMGGSGGTEAIGISTARNVTIGAPTTGAGLTLADTALLVLGAAAGNGASMKFLGSSAAQGKNWLIGNQFNLGDTLEFTPSTANGGSTFTTPALKLLGNGNLIYTSAGTSIFQVGGTTSPVIQGFGPTAAALVDMTPDKGTFTLTLTGMTAATTVTAQWSRNGNQVILNIPVVTGTSNATTFTCTGLPAVIQPTNQQCVSRSQLALGAGSIGAAEGQISGGTITWITLGSSTGFSASGTKGFQFGATLSWELN